MKYLKGVDERAALGWIDEAVKVARNASCLRDKCGSVVVKDGELIGKGFNSPPRDLESQRRCLEDKMLLSERVTDKTCCVHAEQRAISDALRRNPDKVEGSRLYFIRLDGEGNPSRAGEPYCTVCSKRALDEGVAEFVLWHEKGICVYNTEEYNLLSYEFEW